MIHKEHGFSESRRFGQAGCLTIGVRDEIMQPYVAYYTRKGLVSDD